MRITFFGKMNAFLTLMGMLLFVGAASGQIIYNNAGLSTGEKSKSGVFAPSGNEWSETQNDLGNTAESNGTIGAGCQLIGTTTANRCADDFIIPVGQTWDITQVYLYAYQTGYTGTTSPIVGANIRIWRGRPDLATSTIVFGDTTTNRLASTSATNLYRISNSLYPTPVAPGTTRRIWEAAVNTPVSLTAGEYWIDFQINTGTTGNFVPTAAISNARTLPGFNALQQQTGMTTWVALVDAGNPTAAIDVPLDFPFKISGTVSGTTVNLSRNQRADFNGDRKTDFAIARSTGVSAPSTWYILDSASQVKGLQWGLGIGFSGGDYAVPRDFDGDGKTDVAVWRGASTGGAFFILQSQTNTVKTDSFGIVGDDPTAANDYDGDGKADPAVFRRASGGGQSYFYYRGSLNNTAGNITFVPFGSSNDVALADDYDGDGKADPTVIRNENSQVVHYRKLSSGTVQIVNYGLPTDRFVTGDFDRDGRADVTAVRANGTRYDWYVLKSASNSVLLVSHGDPTTDLITPGDYDGDNKMDFAVWRTGTGTGSGNFYILQTSAAAFQQPWGSSGAANTAPDYPVASFDVRKF